VVARAPKIVAAALGICLAAFFAGFIAFATLASRLSAAEAVRGDGIVVLTGGQHRLSEAARLLSEGRGKRLLISGANRIATAEDLHRRSGLDARLFRSSVDIGYAAHDTIGNADETRAWARAHGFSRLIIVTSSYHMPRTLAELGRTLPRVRLIPYPVISRNFHTERWWTHAATARLLFSEYVKFLPAAARLGIARLVGAFEGGALADSAPSRPAN
jgi:uncharacterized SAM-binding protein YcdF (DUF218 family)